MVRIMVEHDWPGRSSWAKSVRSSFSRTVMGLTIWENPIAVRLGEGFQLGCLFVYREKGLFLSVSVDDIKMAGQKQNIDPIWKLLNKEVDLGEPTSFVDHVYLGCTRRQSEISKDIVDNYRAMFESRISPSGTEKLPHSENFRVSSWSYDMEGHAKKCVERYCELANKTTQQLYKVSTPYVDDHHFKEEEMKSVGEVPNCECAFVNIAKGVFLSVYVDDIKVAGEKQNIETMWMVLMKHVDLGEPTSFPDHVFLGCTRRQCDTNHNIVDNFWSMFESRISAGPA